MVEGGGGGRAFDESKVKRNKSGRFAKIESRVDDRLAALEAQWKERMTQKWGKAALESETEEEFRALFPPDEADARLKEMQSDVSDYWAEREKVALEILDDEGVTEEQMTRNMQHSGLEAIIRPSHSDGLWYGVRGMKWGVRRSSSQLKLAAAKRGDGDSSSDSATKKPSGPETSQQRYARLQAQARSGKASSMDEADLKFFNSRTEALSKVARLNESNPGWLASTTKKVLLSAAEQQMQAVTNAVATKYISGPLVEQLKDNSGALKAESKTPIDYVGKHRSKTKK